jgi:hypothetical protein
MDRHENFENALNFYDTVTLRLRVAMDGLPLLVSGARATSTLSSPASSKPTVEQAVQALVGKGIALGRYVHRAPPSPLCCLEPNSDVHVVRLGRVHESAAVLEEVVELDPSCASALSCLAAIRVKEER